MKGEEFARLLDVDKTTLSKWENNDDLIGPQSDRLIRVLAVGLDEGLKKKIEEVIREFEHIHRSRRRVPTIQINPQKMSYQDV